jgi:hypothetical protein
MKTEIQNNSEGGATAAVSRWPLLIHYGSNVFDQNAMKPIKNENWVKPKGGLWTSPVNSEYGWKDWCHSEQFRDCDKSNAFILQLKETAKVLIIDSLKDLENAPLVCVSHINYNQHFLDFETIAKNYDAIWLTENGQYSTRYSHPISLYGWDCESVLLLNAKCCDQVDGACG